MKAKHILFGIILLALGACGSKDKQANNQHEAPALPFQTMIVKEGTAILEEVFPASIRGQEVVEIRPRVQGFIRKFYIDEGAHVKKGQALFQIESPESEQALATAEATLASTKAQVNTAKLNVERIRPLAEKNIISVTQLETYENLYQQALADDARAEAALKNARINMQWATVTSPIDGAVGTIDYRIGSLVNQANIVTTVASIKDIYAYFSLNEKMLIEFLSTIKGDTQTEKIKNSPAVTLKLANGSIYPNKGKIETISGIINPTTGSANFRARFDNDGTLKSGSSGTVIIPESLENSIIIPQQATFKVQDKVLVYKVVEGNVVKQNPITVRPLADGTSYLVESGLKVGEVIVTDGIINLREGQKITPKN